jgi:hypothetical protein
MVLTKTMPLAAALAGVLASAPFSAGRARVGLDFETGIVFCTKNDVRVPGTTGTAFSLVDDLSSDHEPFFRARISYVAAKRHTVSFLVAQLTLPASGRFREPLSFNGTLFPARTPLKAEYRFDSYRLTYRYTIRSGERFEWALGLTGKIRDASIKLEDQDVVSEKKNTGFVPLVNFLLRWSFAPDVWFLIEGDALAAPQGRAEDVLLAVQYWPTEQLGFKAGYRVLEGGVDVDEVYNFTLLHYAVIGLYTKF